jgi:hypothetical protein
MQTGELEHSLVQKDPRNTVLAQVEAERREDGHQTGFADIIRRLAFLETWSIAFHKTYST